MNTSQKKVFLYAALITVLFILWQSWQEEHPVSVSALAPATQAENTNLPPLAAMQNATQPAASAPSPEHAVRVSAKATTVHVNTDVLETTLDTQGGNIVDLKLLQYPQTVDQTQTPVTLFSQAPNIYVAQSGLIGLAGPDTETGQAVYQVEKSHYRLAPGEDTLEVKLTWTNDQGLHIAKIFTFKKGAYEVNVRYEINNQSKADWTGQLYAQLSNQPTATKNTFFGLHTYVGAALSSAETHYEKLNYSQFQKENLDRNIQGGWLAMQQRYFLSAWIPDKAQQNRYYTRYAPNENIYTLGYVGPVIHANAGQTKVVSAQMYAGPEITDTLAKIAPHLELTVDYGILWPISEAIFAAMKYIHQVIGNWGWSIVLVTLLIKLLFYKLSAASYRSMAKMRKLAPQMTAIRERFKGDNQKISQSMFELYRKEKVSPLSGCLPMIIQIPFFIALYYVLIESVELRQAPFVFWIHDLSAKDPYFVLPILMGVSMFLQQRLSPAPPDPAQARVMMFLPVIFTVFFSAFPAGLVLYWLVNNCVSALQQWYVMSK